MNGWIIDEQIDVQQNEKLVDERVRRCTGGWMIDDGCRMERWKDE